MKTPIEILVAKPNHPSGMILVTAYSEPKGSYLCVQDYLQAEFDGLIKINRLAETTIPSDRVNVIYSIVKD